MKKDNSLKCIYSMDYMSKSEYFSIYYILPLPHVLLKSNTSLFILHLNTFHKSNVVIYFYNTFFEIHVLSSFFCYSVIVFSCLMNVAHLLIVLTKCLFQMFFHCSLVIISYLFFKILSVHNLLLLIKMDSIH